MPSFLTLPKTVCRQPHGTLAAIVLVTAACSLAGCGYMVGGAYDPQIRSVHVPTFTSEAYRRGFEVRLTEAVQKQIQNRSHLRLAKEPYADTRLTGRIIGIRKDVLGETAFDDPRQLQLQLQVEVSWVDIRSGRVLAQQQVPIAPEAVHLVSDTSFAPEVGQSLATGTQDAIDQMSRRIVEMMESPW